MRWPIPSAPSGVASRRAGRRLNRLLGRAVPLLLRGSLGITFVWFGALKLAGEPTLPASLIAAITPGVDPDVSVPLVGAVEVVFGAGLLLGRGCRSSWPGSRCSCRARCWCCCCALTWPSWTATRCG
jgi:DoxX